MTSETAVASESSKPFFLQAIDALKSGDRRGAAALLTREVRDGKTAQKNLPSVSQLAAHIGEIDLAIEASKRWCAGSLQSLLGYCAILATYGRAEEAIADIERLPSRMRNDPAVLHFRGNIANQFGRFDEATRLYRQAIATDPTAMQTWFALSMLKSFKSGDPDLDAMERLERATGAPPDARASLCYGIGKGWEDCGDVDRAFTYYAKGAALQRMQRPFDMSGYRAIADRVIRDYTQVNLETLTPSLFRGQRSLFVSGLPRSGTTLTEQMLVGNSAVADGAELNLFGTALMPLLGTNWVNAARYQAQSSSPDPWGEIARDYVHLVDVQFRSQQLVVDKSLGQTMLFGLLLHAMPDARIAWLRRNPDDVALSCFATYFATGLTWSCDLADIADYMRTEDELVEHWRTLFPERIMIVPYEDLVSSPGVWAERLQSHFNLEVEAGLEDMHKRKRAIRTASVGQVRQPISTRRIGRAAAFERHLKPFRERYYR